MTVGWFAIEKQPTRSVWIHPNACCDTERVDRKSYQRIFVFRDTGAVLKSIQRRREGWQESESKRLQWSMDGKDVKPKGRR